MLYVIGDTHLSINGNKEMDVFGGNWEGYTAKLEKSFSALNEDDTVILAGDTSWGMSLMESLPDFEFLQRLPAKKILLKGNHDYFWETTAKMTRFFEANNLTKLNFLHNNAILFENTALCGTRGWFYEEEKSDEQDEKILKRELGRLRASLEDGKKVTDGEKIVFLHYPPLYEGYRCDEIVDMMNEYGIKRCYYGHLHGHSRARAIEGDYKGIFYKLISADHLDFEPYPVLL